MYPRLYLARNLLKEDGVVFVSCDDNEVANLRALMNEVFGEEKFIATVIWQKVFSPKNSAKHLSDDHDYIVIYARYGETWRPQLYHEPRRWKRGTTIQTMIRADHGLLGDLSARNYYSEGLYSITCPSGRVISGPPPGSYWRVSAKKFAELNGDNRVWWGKDGNGTPRLKRFLSDVKQGRVPQTFWPYAEVGHTQDAKKELLEFVKFEDTANVLDTVKPTALIRRMLQIATRTHENDIVLDFFAGSGTTGHSVLLQNHEDGGNRKFILIQLPEPLPKPEDKLKTIADICKQRISGVVGAIERETAGKLNVFKSEGQKQGFRDFKLAESNFTAWEGEASKDAKTLEQQLTLHIDHLRKGRTASDFLYEILLKGGFVLTGGVEKYALEGLDVFGVAGGALLICLERKLTLEAIRAMAEKKPERVVCLDEGFAGNDQLKTNAVQTFKSKGVVFRTV